MKRLTPKQALIIVTFLFLLILSTFGMYLSSRGFLKKDISEPVNIVKIHPDIINAGSVYPNRVLEGYKKEGDRIIDLTRKHISDKYDLKAYVHKYPDHTYTWFVHVSIENNLIALLNPIFDSSREITLRISVLVVFDENFPYKEDLVFYEDGRVEQH